MLVYRSVRGLYFQVMFFPASSHPGRAILGPFPVWVPYMVPLKGYQFTIPSLGVIDGTPQLRSNLHSGIEVKSNKSWFFMLKFRWLNLPCHPTSRGPPPAAGCVNPSWPHPGRVHGHHDAGVFEDPPGGRTTPPPWSSRRKTSVLFWRGAGQ